MYNRRIYTVNGVTGNLKQLSIHFGVPFGTVYRRKGKLKWTIEQSLGVEPPPNPERHGGQTRQQRAALLPRLAEPEINLWDAWRNLLDARLGGTRISAEEFLRREGVVGASESFHFDERNESS